MRPFVRIGLDWTGYLVKHRAVVLKTYQIQSNANKRAQVFLGSFRFSKTFLTSESQFTNVNK